jgi:hypothetical protein
MIQVTKSEITEVLQNMEKTIVYVKENSSYQFVSNSQNNVMFRFDLNTNKYKFYYNKEQFARSIVRFYKRGF